VDEDERGAYLPISLKGRASLRSAHFRKKERKGRRRRKKSYILGRERKISKREIDRWPVSLGKWACSASSSLQTQEKKAHGWTRKADSYSSSRLSDPRLTRKGKNSVSKLKAFTA